MLSYGNKDIPVVHPNLAAFILLFLLVVKFYLPQQECHLPSKAGRDNAVYTAIILEKTK